MTNWISVKDRLPDNNDRVIICDMDAINTYCYPYNYLEACEMGFCENEKWYSETLFEIIESSEEFGQRKLANNDQRWQDQTITHWQPLPEPPK